MDGKELREIRISLGLTQAQLADKLGVALNTISRWEIGAMKIRSPKTVALAIKEIATAARANGAKGGRPRKDESK